MNADPSIQLRLLELQTLDAEVDQLRHQRGHLSQDAEIADLNRQRSALHDRSRDQQIALDDLSAEQARADEAVEQVRTRRVRDQQRLDSGQIGNPKDLERMQHEIATLERRIEVLEDEELEVMARVEDAQRDLAASQQELAATDERLAGLTETRDARAAELDRDLGRVEAGRPALVDGMPEDLLALYDRLRANKGGVGAAELRARQCGGCRLTLDNAEIARIRALPAEAVVRCEECQRILVRTAESGL